MKNIFYIAILLLSIGSFAQDSTSFFEQGNVLYNNGDYEQAIVKYEHILESEEHSAEFYFNLANAHYKLNHVAPSIYYYEQALQLNPNDKEIINNLTFAKNMTIDDIDVLPEVGLSKFVNQASSKFTFDLWSTLSIGFVIGFILLFLSYYFSVSTIRKRLSFVLSSLFLLFAIGSLSFAFHQYNLVANDKPAIVFAQESIIKSEPNSRSEEAFILHEGTKVQILDTVNDWKKIKLSDGKTGWIASNDIKMLNDF